MHWEEAVAMIDWGLVEEAITNWANAKSRDGVSVIWADQNLPEQAYPYITLKRNSVIIDSLIPETAWTFDPLAPNGEQITITHSESAKFTLSIKASTDEANGSNDPNCDAIAILSNLVGSLRTQAAKTILCAANLVVVENHAINDLSLVVSAERISRANVDIVFRTTSIVTEKETYIETVRVKSKDGCAIDGIDVTVGN